MFKQITQWRQRLFSTRGRSRVRSQQLTVPIIPIIDHIMLPGAVQFLHSAEPSTHEMLRRFCREKNWVAISLAKADNGASRLGTRIAVLSQLLQFDATNDSSHLAAQGQRRVRIIGRTHDTPFSLARVELIPDIWKGTTISRDQAKEKLLSLLERWAFLKGNSEFPTLEPIQELSPERICDIFGFYALKNATQKREVLELIDGEKRFYAIEKYVRSEITRMERFPSFDHYPTHFHSIH